MSVQRLCEPMGEDGKDWEQEQQIDRRRDGDGVPYALEIVRVIGCEGDIEHVKGRCGYLLEKYGAALPVKDSGEMPLFSAGGEVAQQLRKLGVLYAVSGEKSTICGYISVLD